MLHKLFMNLHKLFNRSRIFPFSFTLSWFELPKHEAAFLFALAMARNTNSSNVRGKSKGRRFSRDPRTLLMQPKEFRPSLVFVCS